MARSGLYQFMTTCVGSDYETMRRMLDDHPLKSISRRTFAQKIGTEAWKELQAQLGYDRYFPISKDWHVGYYSATYENLPAVFLRHSGIEWIFVRL